MYDKYLTHLLAIHSYSIGNKTLHRVGRSSILSWVKPNTFKLTFRLSSPGAQQKIGNVELASGVEAVLEHDSKIKRSLSPESVRRVYEGQLRWDMN